MGTGPPRKPLPAFPQKQGFGVGLEPLLGSVCGFELSSLWGQGGSWHPGCSSVRMGLLPASGPCGTPVSAPPAVTTACRLHGHLGVRAGVPLGRTGAAWAHTCINTAVHTKLHRLLSLVCVLVGTALRELLNQGSHRGLSVWRDSPVDPSRPLVSFVPFFLFVSAVPTTTGDGTCATAVTVLDP